MRVKNRVISFLVWIWVKFGLKYLVSTKKKAKNIYFSNIFLLLRQRTEKGYLQPVIYSFINFPIAFGRFKCIVLCQI